MKKNFWLIFAALLATRLLAQQPTNSTAPGAIATPAASPAVTNAPPPPSTTNPPAAKSEKKKAAKKKTVKAGVSVKKNAGPELRTVPLIAGPATVVASNVNVRGLA